MVAHCRGGLAVGIALAVLGWSGEAWAPGGTCMAPGACTLRGVDVPGEPTEVATNHLLPLYWGCDAELDQIPGFSASTLFPELVLDDGTVLGADWADAFEFPETGSSQRVAFWQGPSLPPNRTVTVRLRWDGWCALRESVCLDLSDADVDCSMEDSCCYLDDAAADVPYELQTFRTGSEPDLTPPDPPDFSIMCVAYEVAGDRWTVAYLTNASGTDCPAMAGVFENRYLGRLEADPEEAERTLARQIRSSMDLGTDLAGDHPLAAPLGRIDDEAAILAARGTWVVRVVAIDYSGNQSEPGPPQRFQYPEDCEGAENWDAADGGAPPIPDGDGGSGGPAPADAAGAAGVGATSAASGSGAESQTGSTAEEGDGCGCRTAPRRSGSSVALGMLLAALLRRRHAARNRGG